MSRTVKRKKFLTTFKNEIRNNIEDINDYIYGYKSLEKSLSHLSDWNKLEFLNDINYRHYVALAQNQTNKKADLPSFYQLRPTPHKFTFITFEFYHNPIFL